MCASWEVGTGKRHGSVQTGREIELLSSSLFSYQEGTGGSTRVGCMQKGELPCKRHSHSSYHSLTSPPACRRWEAKALRWRAWQRLACLCPLGFTSPRPPIAAL